METKTGMYREDKNDKINHLSYIDPLVVLRYGHYMKEGELKHGRGNWKKGNYPKHEYLESLARHLQLLLLESDHDITIEDTDHAAAIMFNIIGFMYEEIMSEIAAPDTKPSR